MLKIAPSILAADFGRLREQVKQAEAAGADMIHLDIIDGHFAPNISFGAAISKVSVEACSLPHDAHLMVTEPEDYIDDFLKLKVDYITFHLEIDGIRRDLGERRWVYVLGDRPDETRIMALIDKIRKGGAKPGLTLNPPTSIELVYPYLDKIDLLLLMSVNPGFAGQTFINNVYDKIRTAAKYRKDNDLQFEIMVDGGVGLDNAAELHKAGADILVSGSSFFKASDYTEFIRKIKG
ncbi:MAG: ribulose-phosphate 3-epimerase [candidate division Zixibacteria bacterium HGW-Zixibacteria-1]|nr:MAG: ribulose-phosphate 3-epimerase [candidate division Zixibacteria bacterium HGW-Zixibacteria-1]